MSRVIPLPKPEKREVEAYYDVTADSYDRLHGEEQRAKYAEALKALEGKAWKTILDAGCGTGLLFSELGRFESLVGVDLSRRMLEKARKKIKGKNVHLVRCDVENLPFKPGVFEACFLFTVAQNLPNPLKAFQELGRVAREGAAMALTVMDGVKVEIRDVLAFTGLKLALKTRIGREILLAGCKSQQ